MINLPFYKVLNLEIPAYMKYWIIKNKKIPKHLMEIIDQTPPVTLENTLALPLENFKIIGKTEQTQIKGEQLFNINDSITQGTLEKYNNGFRLVKGTNRIVQFTLGKILSAGTYTLSASVVNSTLSNLSSLYVAYKKENGTNILTSQFLVDGTVTLTEDCYKLYFYILNTESDEAEITIDNVMLNSGSTAKTFEEFCGGVPSPNPDYPQTINNVSGNITISVTDENNENSQEVVFPLAEGQKLMEGDYLADDGIHHTKGQITFDGTETWQLDTQNKLIRTIIENLKSQSSQSTITTAFCSHFSKGSIVSSRINKYEFTTYQSSVWFNRNSMTINEWKTWLSSNNVTVEYELAEETLETFTETQATKFEEIKALTGYNNITIVNATSSDLTPNVSLKYYAKGWR